MKHPVDNITYEGQGWNPHAIVAEGLPKFQDRVIADGHYTRDEEGMPLTEDQRKEVAKGAFEKAKTFIADQKAAKEAAAKAAAAEATPQAQPQGETGPEKVVDPKKR